MNKRERAGSSCRRTQTAYWVHPCTLLGHTCSLSQVHEWAGQEHSHTQANVRPSQGLRLRWLSPGWGPTGTGTGPWWLVRQQALPKWKIPLKNGTIFWTASLHFMCWFHTVFLSCLFPIAWRLRDCAWEVRLSPLLLPSSVAVGIKGDWERHSKGETEGVLYLSVFSLGDCQLLQILSNVNRVWGKGENTLHSSQVPFTLTVLLETVGLFMPLIGIWHEGQIYFPFHTKWT